MKHLPSVHTLEILSMSSGFTETLSLKTNWGESKKTPHIAVCLCTDPCMHAYTLLYTHPHKNIHTLHMCAYIIKYKSFYNLLTNESIEMIQNRSGHILFPLMNTSFTCFVVEVSNSEFFIFID